MSTNLDMTTDMNCTMNQTQQNWAEHIHPVRAGLLCLLLAAGLMGIFPASYAADKDPAPQRKQISAPQIERTDDAEREHRRHDEQENDDLPSIVLSSPANNSVSLYPAIATVEASVTFPGKAGAHRDRREGVEVEFLADGQKYAEVKHPPYRASYTPAKAGLHTLTARIRYGEGRRSILSAPVTIIANVPPSISLTAPAATASLYSPASITFSANATAPVGNIARVDYYNGSILIGSSASSPYSISWNNVPVDNYSLTAVATDNYGASTTSSPVAVSVMLTPSSTSLTTTPNPVNAGQPTSLSATVSGAPPTGSITFKDGANTLGTANLNTGSNTASLNYTFVTAGSHNLSATYSGDANNTGSASNSSSLTVNPATSTTVLTVTPNPVNVGQAVTLTAAVTGLTPGGSVTFLDGSTMLGTASLTAGSTSLNVTFTTAGAHGLTASYAGDSSNLGSSSSPVNVTVNSGVAQAYYIHTDQLDTPREITDGSGNVVWQWDNTDPYGNNSPNENPSGLGRFEFNKRFAGQYFDRETNIYYNVMRDYDPATGRYIQSDPIGLEGGSFSTYTYVNGNPLSYTDPMGLDANLQIRPPSLLTLSTIAALRRDTTLDQAVRDGELTRSVTLPAIGLALSPILVGSTLEAGAAVCRAVPEVLPKVAEACKNPLLALTLGAAICGNVSGTVKGSARSFPRDRERIEDIIEASGKTLRRNTGNVPKP